MRSALNKLYRVSGAIGAFFIVGICVIVLIQVGFNTVDRVIQTVTGEAIGLVLPSYAEFAGYFLAAATFFALADTLQTGNHIRVTLVIQTFSPAVRRASETFCCFIGMIISLYFTFWAFNLVRESWQFGDMSPGIIAVPVWIPQLSMALGLVCLSICFIDLFVQTLRGKTPAYMDDSITSSLE